MRKTTIYTVGPDGQRDAGKHFVITEAPASQADRWATRALMAAAKAGVNIPDNLLTAGVAGLTTIALQALMAIPYYEAEALLDEMMSCIQIMPDPSKPMVVRGLVETDIEEIATRFKLRGEVIELHTGFWRDAAPSISTGTVATENPTPAS